GNRALRASGCNELFEALARHAGPSRCSDAASGAGWAMILFTGSILGSSGYYLCHGKLLARRFFRDDWTNLLVSRLYAAAALRSSLVKLSTEKTHSVISRTKSVESLSSSSSPSFTV